MRESNPILDTHIRIILASATRVGWERSPGAIVIGSRLNGVEMGGASSSMRHGAEASEAGSGACVAHRGLAEAIGRLEREALEAFTYREKVSRSRSPIPKCLSSMEKHLRQPTNQPNDWQSRKKHLDHVLYICVLECNIRLKFVALSAVSDLRQCADSYF